MKKMSSIFGLVLLATSVAYAQTHKPEASVKPPVLTDTQKLAYFKATSEYQQAASQVQQANQAAQQKQTVVQEAVKTLIAACGKDFSPSMDAKNDPVCIANPKSPEKK